MARASRNLKRQSRHRRIRKTVSGTAGRPRMCVFRSLNHMYVQLIDDAQGRTLAQASTLEKGFDGPGPGGNVAAARKAGELIGRRAREKGITKVVFDRAGYLYHGRVKALAEGARETGLEF
ncbi:MAG: 50S ribosomal protein L18 [Nitrospirota bacterium]